MIAATEPRVTDLLRRIGRGDESALEDLQTQTRKPLMYSIRRIVSDPRDGEEVLQDVYTYVWRHAAEYRKDRGSTSAWLHILARSRALDRRRLTQRYSGTVEFDERDTVVDERPHDPYEVWRRSQLWEWLQELPAGQERLLKMAFLEGFSYSEIAARTSTPLGTVKTRIRKALLTMREKLADESLPLD